MNALNEILTTFCFSAIGGCFVVVVVTLVEVIRIARK